MFKCMIGGTTCKLSLLFPAVLLLLLKLDDSGVTLFCFSAAVLHEAAHGVALCACRIRPQTLTLSFFGMRLDLPPSHQMTLFQTVAVVAAGPLANACSAIALKWADAPARFTAAHLVLAALNGLPVLPLDGGQIAVAVLERACSCQTAARLERLLFWMTWGMLAFLGAAVCFHSGGNFTLLAVSIYLGGLRLFCKCD